MARSIWLLATAASVASASGAHAAERRFAIDVPAADLASALAALSLQTGASIGIDLRIEPARSRAVRGRHTIAEALAKMLGPTPYRAERMGPTVWRLVRRPTEPKREVAAAPTADIVVTARKLTEPLSRAAPAVSVYVPGRGAAAAGAHDVAAGIEGLAVTNLGPGRDRPFIRGVADSPFNGFTQTTVSVNVDDARVTYDAPEPGLRLVDVSRVEVLKGPQGPLYGTGALGGVYRIVPNKPSTDSFGATSDLAFSSVAGGLGAAASGVVNAPLLDGRAAVRLAAYGDVASGWIRNAGDPRTINDAVIYGGRIAVRALPASGWVVDASASGQRIAMRDSQYVDRGEEDLSRSDRLPEPSSSGFGLLGASVAGPVGRLRLNASTSQSWQTLDETFDVGAFGPALGSASARTYVDRRRYSVFDQEVRLTSAPGGSVEWTAGASYLKATTLARGSLEADGAQLPFAFLLHRVITEAALFADGSLLLAPRWRIGLGARLFRASTDDERSEDLNVATVARASVGVTPSASLTYAPSEGRTVYLRFGTAFRPGGLDPSNTRTGRYDSDEVRSLELGARAQVAGGRLVLSGGGFHTRWAHIQSDYLLADGLVATRNAGDATILGFEAAADWHSGRLTLSAGAAGQRARLVSSVDGTDLPADRRLPTVPDATARIEARRRVRIPTGEAEIVVGGSYVGASRLSFDDGLDRRMGDFATVHAAVTARLAAVEVRLMVSNLLDVRADTFAFGNPFRVRSESQFTPLQPRAVILGVSRGF